MAVVLKARTAGTVGRAAERMHSREAVERDAIVKERGGTGVFGSLVSVVWRPRSGWFDVGLRSFPPLVGVYFRLGGDALPKVLARGRVGASGCKTGCKS